MRRRLLTPFLALVTAALSCQAQMLLNPTKFTRDLLRSPDAATALTKLGVPASLAGLPDDAAKFLDGTGAWTVPTGQTNVPAFSADTFTIKSNVVVLTHAPAVAQVTNVTLVLGQTLTITGSNDVNIAAITGTIETGQTMPLVLRVVATADVKLTTTIAGLKGVGGTWPSAGVTVTNGDWGLISAQAYDDTNQVAIAYQYAH